jgi:hypothetical protein
MTSLILRRYVRYPLSSFRPMLELGPKAEELYQHTQKHHEGACHPCSRGGSDPKS